MLGVLLNIVKIPVNSYDEHMKGEDAMKRVVYNVVIALVAAFCIGACSVRAEEPAAKAPDGKLKWQILADIPVPQIGCSGAVLNKKFHVIGGCTIGGGASNAHQVYDPATDTWTKKAPLPDKAAWPAVAVWNGKIYIFGGDRKGINVESTARAFVYDPDKDAWTEIAKMPRVRTVCAATAVGDFIYIYGGMESRYADPMVECYRYDPEKDTYTRIADFPEPDAHFINQGYYNGKIYVIYGQRVIDGKWGDTGYADGVLQYDIVHDTWIKQDVKRPIRSRWTLTQHSSHIVSGSRLIIAGGKPPGKWGDMPDLRTEKVWYLDMKTKQFGELPPLPEGRCCGAAGVIDGTLYVAGGFRDEHFGTVGGSHWTEAKLFKPVWALKLPF